MRVISGSFKGRKLAMPSGQDIRPTTDRVKENLFNILENKINWDEVNCLDLFSGSGALGLEALSRGARKAIFIEKSSQAIEIVRTNVRHCLGEKFTDDVAKVVQQNAFSYLGWLKSESINLVFVDPPYKKRLDEKLWRSLLEILSIGAIVTIERESKSINKENYLKSLKLESLHDCFNLIDFREYGRSNLVFIQVAEKPLI